MYCPNCELHFAGAQSAGCCPYCGRTASDIQDAVSAVDGAAASAGQIAASSGTVDVVPDSSTHFSVGSREGGKAAARPGSRLGTRTERRSASRHPLWQPGEQVAGKYEVVSKLGSGGFGTVYKVRHVFRKKYYALKTPHAEFAEDATFRLRFEREIEAMERFVHPDAIMIRDSGLTERGVPYYTMDFIEGESLKELLRREGPLPIDRALRVIRRVLRVLDVAHSHQIIHRDIKPDNILLTRDGGRDIVKVLDFGVAKLLDLVGDTGSITHGMRVGTPKYMSPEQITGDEVVPTSDLFALGIVFFELLTGEHPFSKVKDPIRVTSAILNRPPRDPLELRPEIPSAIAENIAWMLEKLPARRPADADALIRQLGEVDGGVSRVEKPVHLEVSDAAHRQAAGSLVLRQETSLGERRSFLLFKTDCAFGRSSNPERSVHNDVILRALPCRSQQEDPENWKRNLTISQRLFRLRLDGGHFSLEPHERAKYGVCIGGVRSMQPVRLPNDKFHLSIGDRALELDGRRVRRDAWSVELDLGFLAASRPTDVESPQASGYSNASCPFDYVHLQRVSNSPLHDYFIVYRQLSIGSSANAGLRIQGAGIEGRHVQVLFEGGEAFLRALARSVYVRGESLTEEVDSLGDLDYRGARQLPEDVLLPLVPGIEVFLGDRQILVSAASDSLYKTV